MQTDSTSVAAMQDMEGAGDLRTGVLSSLDQIGTHHADWLRLCEHPEAHPATFSAVCAANPDLIRPHIVMVYEGNAVVAMAVARIQVEPIPVKFGLAVPFEPRLRVVRVSYRGITGAASPAIRAKLIDALSAPLLADEADALLLDHITLCSPMQLWCAKPPAPLRRDRAPSEHSVHWVAELGGDYATFTASMSRRERTNLKKLRARLRRELGNRVRVACYRDASAFATVDADTTRLAARTYQSALGQSYSQTYWSRPLLQSALKMGAARCYVLYVDDEPASFCHGLLWRGTFHMCFLGYDPRYASLAIGRYIVQHAIEDVCDADGALLLDFGFGHAEHKRRLGSDHWIETERYVFAPRFKPMAVNMLRGAIGTVASWSDRLVARLGLRDRIKRVWWRSLTTRKARQDGRHETMR